jgi:hypothetical protein
MQNSRALELELLEVASKDESCVPLTSVELELIGGGGATVNNF